jgi:glutathionylspermidine synthase
MTSPLTAGRSLPRQDWLRLRLRVIFDHCKWDPQSGDRAVLGSFPLLVEKQTVDELAGLAGRLTEEALRAEQEILRQPKLLERLAVPRPIRRCFERGRAGAARDSVRVMRFDFHFTTNGWQISEVNADVPGGYVEATGWNELFAAETFGTTAPSSPTRAYAAALSEAVPDGSLIVLAHATVYSEDRQVMAHLARELAARGMRVCLASPANLIWNRGQAALAGSLASGTPAAVVRLTPAEWLPSACGRGGWEPWFEGSPTCLSNPGRAIVLQSKRFPLVWNALSTDLPTWRRLLPESWCPSEIGNLAADDLVVKPAFGRVGEDVAIRGVTPEPDYAEILRAARRDERRWIVQRRFEVAPVDTGEGPVFPSIGVFTVNGKMAGLYGRASHARLIDGTAQDVAVLVRGEPGEGHEA